MKRYYLLMMMWGTLTSMAQTDNWKTPELHSEKTVLGKLSEHVMSLPSWVDNTHYITYTQLKDGHPETYLMDAATGKTELLINDIKGFTDRHVQLTGDSTVNQDNLRIFGIRFVGNSTDCFTFRNRGKVLIYDRRTGKLALHKEDAAQRPNGRPNNTRVTTTTADSLFTMLGDRFNLYIRNNKTNRVKQLTNDGKPYASYCSSSAKNKLSERNPNGRWYGHRYLCMMQDDSEVGDLFLLNALTQPRPMLKTKKMPLPKEKGVRHSKLFWYNADTDEFKQIDIDKWQGQKVSFDYIRNDKDLYLTRSTRGADTLELCHIDIETGKMRILITEVAKPHFNVNVFNYRLVNGDRNILWWSDRSGHGHYYLYDTHGKLLNRVTQGKTLVAGNILFVDSLTQQMVFAGYGGEKNVDPNYTYYYKVQLNGKNQQCLTLDNGEHQLAFSYDRKYAISKCSRMDMPPVYSLINLEKPNRPKEIKRVDEDALKAAGWLKPQLVKVKAADEQTDLYGIMYLPANMDKTKKYPLISNVYPGPQSDQIPRAFTIDENGNQSLADLGFVVINIQSRGSSPFRDKKFYTYGYGHLRDYPLADDKHTIETLAAQHSFIDLERVGIYGHSGGGFQTVAAMLTYPDFYKVGVASSGNHDNNIYIDWWANTYHGSGKIPTNMELAKNLKGKLLLMTGDVDDNVPYASTLRMADALIKADKPFDMFVFPGMDHNLHGSYYENKIRNYFKHHLLNENGTTK